MNIEQPERLLQRKSADEPDPGPRMQTLLPPKIATGAEGITRAELLGKALAINPSTKAA